LFGDDLIRTRLLLGSHGGHMGSEGGDFLIPMGPRGVQKGDDIIVASKL
jgi:hypothetical protein